MPLTPLRPALLALLAVSLLSCQSPLPAAVTPALDTYADLTAEYADFSTLALTQNYLERKVRTWVALGNGAALRREVDFARLKHPTLLQTVMASDASLCQSALGAEDVQLFRAQSPLFDTYVSTFGCAAPAPTPTPEPTPTPVPTPTPPPALGEIVVGTITDGEQQRPRVALDEQGGFVMAWSSTSNSIKTQRFDASGVALTPELRADSVGNIKGSLAMARHDQGWIATWGQLDTYGTTTSGNVYAQRLDANGNLVGGEFRVNPSTTISASNPDIVAAADGSFMIAWVGLEEVYLRRYNAAGQPLTEDVRINSFTTSYQGAVKLALNASGQFVATWQSYDQDQASGYGVYVQRYAANGTPVGSEMPVNTYITSNQYNPDVVMNDDGSFTVVWQSIGQDGDSSGIFAQRFDNAGNKVGGEFRVNTYTTNNQENPTLAADAQGNFAVAWLSAAQDGSGGGIYAQRYLANGTPQGSEFRVNTYTPGTQRDPHLSMNALGLFMIAWSDARNSGDINAQRFDAAGNPL